MLNLSVRLHDDSEELTILSADSKLTVRSVTVEVDHITGIKCLDPVAELMLHHALCDDCNLMTVMNMKIHGLFKCFRIKRQPAAEWLTQLLLEVRSHVKISTCLITGDRNALALSYKRICNKVRT